VHQSPAGPNEVADVEVSPGPEARRDDVANAILGDGSLLLTLSRRGEIEQLWWPHVDRDEHLGELRLVVVNESGGTWLDDPDLDHDQRYDDGADVLVTEAAGSGPGRVTLTDVVAVDGPVLLRRVSGAAGRVGVFVRPEMLGTARAGGAYVDPVSSMLVVHRRSRVLAVGMSVPATVAVGERRSGDDLRVPLLAGRLVHGGVAHGQVEGALLAADVAPEVVVAIAAAECPEEAIARVMTALQAGMPAQVAARRSADAAVVARASRPRVGGPAAVVDRRTQLVFSRLSDRATGGVLAAPEVDPDFRRSGGYGFVWPRDLAFILLAYLACERDDLAIPALRWLMRAQAADGLWLQRSWTDGTLAPSWGTQLDETGAVLAAYEVAWHCLGDAGLDADLWPSAARAADALVRVLDPVTGLPAPSMDLWEERLGVHTFTAATTHAGLRAAAAMAERHDPARGAGWRDAAARVRAGIEQHLWDEAAGRFVRSLHVARRDGAGAPVPPAYGLLAHPMWPVGSVDPVDATVDVSLLGLAYPFGVLPADDPRMRATIAAVRDALTTADGGLLRYVGDVYEGGNPWVLARLWLDLTERAADATAPTDGIEYALAHRTSTDLLPEQVNVATGAPAWVVPLTWSHAMFALACRPDPPGLPMA
jgi:glucoamylase